AGPRAGDARPHARAALRLLDDPDPDHVRARRQHVPALSHERDHAEDGTGHVQRLGARRLSQSVLAKRTGLATLAAGRRSCRPHDPVSLPRARARPAVGDGVDARPKPDAAQGPAEAATGPAEGWLKPDSTG